MRVHEIVISDDLRPEYLQQIVQYANQYRSDIKIRFEAECMQLDAKSILGMMFIPIRRGTRLTIQTKGADEEEAIEMMSSMLENKERQV
ncbi:HPr family phosphocarrier protein [Paenibacillus tyrfis]|uniref:HPr family phosphocarrier protein n=1 Tax=Paenibacillus tyrfis TaxID=1501230 RepID=UPI0020A0285E|nr:HPr family phosphocarrier protein [Paenibacillus tyrfis]MCP1305776.1 HPr family phosphocarrier protein [Paenibacillus tyrfis]